jgi:DNA-binding transcriptional LysR family regulator
MDRFRELEIFVAVAEHGAFNAAARNLAASPPAVTRAIAALEARLDIRLFTRSTRQVALTEAGSRFLIDARRILGSLAEAEASAAGDHDAPRGQLRITAPVLFGQSFIAPILRDYLDAHGAVTANAVFLDRIVDLIDEGYDIAVRIGDLSDSGLVATWVGAVRRVVVAAPDYVARHGAPAQPQDLQNHRIVLPTAASGSPNWEFSAGGSRRTVRLEPVLSVSTMGAGIDAAAAGWGVTRVLSYQVADAVADGRLVELLERHEDRELPIHLVHSEGRRPSAKVRTFVDFAAIRLRAAAGSLMARP